MFALLSSLRLFIGSRLQNKFTLFFVIFASLPLLTLGGTALYLIDLSHRFDVANLELQLIDQKIEEIGKFFADTLDVLNLRVGITERTDIDVVAKSGRPWQDILAKELLGENVAFEEVSFINLQGKETAKKSRIAGDIEFLNVSHLPKFREALGGKNYIGEVYYTLSGPMVTFAAPVLVEDRVIQVLSAEVNLSQVRRSIEAARLGAAGYLVLLDTTGSVIAHRGQGDVRVGSDFIAIERVKRVLGGEILDGLDRRDRYESFFGNVPVVGAGRKIPKIGWMVLAEWPIEDADRIVHDIRDQVIRLTLFSILAVLAIAPFFARRLVQPIRELEKGVSEIEQGNFEKRVDVKTEDELEDLGAAFNRMARGLKRLQELKSEFVFIAAHELRTPVTAIKGFLSLIFEGTAGPVSAPVKKFLEPIQEASERLGQLVNDILEIARSEAGRIKIEVFSVDIHAAIRSMIGQIKPLAEQKKITLTYEEPKELLLVLADTARVKEVITNLVSNAIKYNREGGWIKIYHGIGPGFVATHVEDNGLGIPEKDQGHIFEKFFRAESGAVRQIQGTGLGLFITRELVEKMGGKISFTSEEGKGTTFSFILPASPFK